jgi:hypothetical protein
MLKSKLSNLLILILFSVNVINGQKVTISVSAELERLYGRLAKNLSDSVKLQANDSINSMIESYVGSDSVFSHRFKNLRYLGEVTSPDSIVKIVTWNLILVDRPGRYFSYFIKKQKDGKSNIIQRLTAEYSEGQISTDTTYSADSWYGALYYDIRPQTIDGKISWVLLGIDYGNPLITRKIIDVLDYSHEDRINFGMKLFLSQDTIKYREIFEYSSDATMSLRFANDGSIVFDHLVPLTPELTNNHQYYAPHYSNDAYVYENGLWRYKLNVDARNIQ